MTFILTLLAFICAATLAFLRRPKTAAASFIVAVLLTFGIGSGVVTAPLLRAIQSGYETTSIPTTWPATSAILLLGMGTANVQPGLVEVGPLSHGRILMAMQVYRSCKRAGGVCKLIVTGGDTATPGVSEASVYGAQLVSLGADSDDITYDHRAQSTWENAEFTRPILESLNPDQVYLVTSGIHMKRALLYFQHFGVVPIPIRSDYLLPWDTIIPMSFNFAAADLAIAECRGLLRYRAYNAMGWNDPPLAPIANSR
jgi:uncharacterized SAM-binding protein YcdF (DUF218 family)